MSWLSWIKDEVESSKRVDPYPRGDIPRQEDRLMTEDTWLQQLREQQREQARMAEEHRQQRLQQEVLEQARRMAIERERRQRQERMREGLPTGRNLASGPIVPVDIESIGYPPGYRSADTGARLYQSATTSAFRMPDMYQFDFTKINSIEEMGKVLEVICTKLPLQMTEELIIDAGIKDIVKKVER